MAITIGTFTCDYLTAQPYAYEGDARLGLTARTFRVSGLLSAAQWRNLINEYDEWRDARLGDQDTLLSQTVGSTINLTVDNANGLGISSLPCWFAEPPSGEQAGIYVQASAVLVDAVQALAVLLRQRGLDKENQQANAADADCAVIAANMQRQKDDTDCEIAALSSGLADDFAGQNVAKELITKTAELVAYSPSANALAQVDSNRELVAKTAELAAFSVNAAALAVVDSDREIAAKTASNAAFVIDADALAVLDSDREVVAKDAELTAYTANAAEIAATDASREVVAKTAELTAYEGVADDLATLESDREVTAKTAELAAYTVNADALANLDSYREVAAKTAENTAFASNAAALATLDFSREVSAKTAELSAYATSAATLADLDSDRGVVAKTAELAAFTANAATLADLDSDREVVAKTAENTAYAVNAAALATLDSSRELTAKGAEATAYAVNADALAVIDSDRELVSKTSDLAAFATNAGALAAVEADRNIAAQQAELDALEGITEGTDTRADALAEISVAREVLNKTAELAARTLSAATLAGLDLQQEVQSAEAKASVYGTYVEDLKTAEIAIEEADLTARAAIFDAGGMDTLKTLRSFQALIDKYLTEDLPDLGTELLGGVTIKLSKPVASRANGPTVTSTAGGFSLIQGPLQALASKSIEGYVTSGTIGNLMDWYDATIAVAASAGTWFPTRPPSVTGAESVLVAGIKTTRYTVTAEVAQLI